MNTEAKEPSLNIGEGWSEIDPRETGYTILIDGDRLTLNSTSFRNRTELGYISGVNCPIAVDDEKKLAYRAVHKKPDSPVSDLMDYIENTSTDIVSFDLVTHEETIIASLPIGVDCHWLLEYLPDSDSLIALLSDRKKLTQSFVADINPKSGIVTTSRLVESAFYPAAIDHENERIAFSGRKGGVVLVDFKGKLIAETSTRYSRHLEGADFLDRQQKMAIGGRGIHIWDIGLNQLETIRESGDHPVLLQSNVDTLPPRLREF